MPDTTSASAAPDHSTDGPRHHRVSLTIDLGGDQFATASIHFGKTWTRITAIDAGTSIAIDPTHNGYELHRVLRATNGHLPRTIELHVTYEGERPKVRSHRGEQMAAAKTPEPANANVFVPPAKSGTPIADVFLERARRVEANGDEAQRFFFDLDRLTYFPLLAEQGDKKLAATISHYAAFLEVRTLRRATYVKYGLRYPGSSKDESFRAAATTVAPLLRRAFVEVERDGRIDTDRLADHVYRFVNGDLAMPIDDTQNRHSGPNSANFFSFTEVLLHFRALDIDWDYWQHAVRPFVVGSMAFAHLYWDRRSRRRASYDPSHLLTNNAGDWKQWRQLEATLLERAPAEPMLFLEDMFGDTVAHALRDDVALSPMKNLFLAP